MYFDAYFLDLSVPVQRFDMHITCAHTLEHKMFMSSPRQTERC